MSDIVLTKDADKLICIIYKVYLQRIKSGNSKSSAVCFASYEFQKDFPNLKEDDIVTELSELKKNNLIELWIDGSFILLANGIVYMENRFKNGLAEVTDFISKFIP